MKKIIFAQIFFVMFLPAAMAAEQDGSAQFSHMSKAAEKVFIGRIIGESSRHYAKIMTVEITEAWQGCTQGELVSYLTIDSVAHSGDPGRYTKNSEFLFYVRKPRTNSKLAHLGSDFFLPVSGNSAVIPLKGEEGENIRSTAKLFLSSKQLTVAELTQLLTNPSARIRSSALAALAQASAGELEQQAMQIVSYLHQERDLSLQAQALMLLAESRVETAVEPAIELVLSQESNATLLPLAAHLANQTDPRLAVEIIAAKAEQSHGTQIQWAARLLWQLQTPEAIGEYLRLTNRQQPGKAHIFSRLRTRQSNAELIDLLSNGSEKEKKAAALFIIRWGSQEQKRQLREQLARENATLRQFVEHCLKHPEGPIPNF